MTQIRVLVVDGDLESRATTKRAIGRAGLEFAGESGHGTEAVSLALHSRPDAVLIAVEEPAARALDTVDGLVNALPTTPIIVYSTRRDADSVRKAMVVGAREYITRPVEVSRLREAVQVALGQEARRELQRAGLAGIRGRGTVLAITGAKGGVGKSVLAVNLAAALSAEHGRSIAVIDADTHFGDIATMFDLAPTTTISDLMRNWSEVDRGSIRQYVTKDPATGIEVLAASDDDESAWDRCSPDDVKRLIDTFAQVYDFVIIDTTGGFGSFVRACVESATLTLVVTSDDVSSVRDTAAAVRRLERWQIAPERLRYIVNQESARKGVKLRDISEAIGRQISWVLPYDQAVLDSVQAGEPVVLRNKRSSASRVITSLATLIGGVQGPRERPSFIGRVLPGRGLVG